MGIERSVSLASEEVLQTFFKVGNSLGVPRIDSESQVRSAEATRSSLGLGMGTELARDDACLSRRRCISPSGSFEARRAFCLDAVAYAASCAEVVCGVGHHLVEKAWAQGIGN